MPSVLDIDPHPRHFLRYRNAARRGGWEVARLPLHVGRVGGLPDGLDGLVVASDLQGRVPAPTGELRLLGEVVPRWLAELAELDDALPSPARCGVLLAGDLYAVPGADKRGGYGDVDAVWRAFADGFRWVAGVAGNHDDVDPLERRRPPNAHLLDGAIVELDGLRVGGVGRVMGDPTRRGKRDADDQLAAIALVAEQRPDVLVLHEGPPADELPGHPAVLPLVGEVPWLVCGHVPWPVARRGRVLNAHERVVVLVRA